MNFSRRRNVILTKTAIAKTNYKFTFAAYETVRFVQNISGGDFLSKSYYDLFELLDNDDEAEGFFHGLPEYAREIIEDRAEKIRSIEDLKDTAETLL